MTFAIRPSSKTLDALWRWEDLLDLPDDGKLYEFIDGELYEMAPSIPVHQELSSRLHTAFSVNVSERRLGTVYAFRLGCD
jgi:Uma2 family endonuclease